MRHGLPRHMLLRLAALELVRAMLSAVGTPVDMCPDVEARAQAVALCSRIDIHRERAFRLTVGGERLDLSRDDKASGRYFRQIAAMRRELTAGWGETMDAPALLSAVLALVAQAEEQVPGTAAYAAHREAWGTLHGLLGDLYAVFDPEYEDAQGIAHGCRVGERMIPA